MSATTTMSPRNLKFEHKNKLTEDTMTEINTLKMDSDEERHFYEWLIEAEKAGLVSDIEYPTGSFELAERASVKVKKQLKTKTKIVDKFLFHPHKYTPDFSFTWLGSNSPFFTMLGTTWVDVKGTFNGHGDPKQFSINQKWMFDKFGLYINKVVPVDLFRKSWVPENCRYSPKMHKPVKKYIGMKTINDFMGDTNE